MGLARKTTLSAISSGLPTLPIGVFSMMGVKCLSTIPLGVARPRSVAIIPGATQLMRIPCLAKSIASALVRPRIACLEVMYYAVHITLWSLTKGDKLTGARRGRAMVETIDPMLTIDPRLGRFRRVINWFPMGD
jgi:hypothetical protein